jgi:alkaline phosphatase D
MIQQDQVTTEIVHFASHSTMLQMNQNFFFLAFLLNLSCVSNEPSTTTLAFSSCNDPSKNLDVLPTLQAALDTIPTCIWLGDNVYLKEKDWQSTDAALSKYQETFATPALATLLQTGTHYAIWDDHDAGPNDCDRSFKGMSATMQAFKQFWAPTYPMPDSMSYYGTTSLSDGAVDLFFLDNRSFRTHHDSANATVFGEAQLQWLEEAYTASQAPFKILLMGGQFLTTAHVFENVSRFPADRERLIRLLSSTTSAPIVLTGDRHHGELSRLDTDFHPILEATASPLTAQSFPHHDEANETRLHEGTTAVNHFGTLSLTHENGKAIAAEMKLIDAEGNVIFEWRETYENI